MKGPRCPATQRYRKVFTFVLINPSSEIAAATSHTVAAAAVDSHLLRFFDINRPPGARGIFNGFEGNGGQRACAGERCGFTMSVAPA